MITIISHIIIRSLSHSSIVVENWVFVVTRLEPEEALNAEEFVLREEIKELSHNVYWELLELCHEWLNLLVSHGHWSIQIKSFHQWIISLSFIKHGLENIKILQLEEDPGGSNLIHDPFEKWGHTLQ